MKRILVLCGGNSCRSQMAEAYLRLFVGKKAEVLSAGLEAHGLNPNSVIVMKEDGIDISKHTSNSIDEYKDVHFDMVITVCDNSVEECPYFPTKAVKFHHDFPDPAKCKGTPDEVLKEFRKVRDMVKAYCKTFVEENL
jgi:arsenate reductase (thioredoxin)